MIIPPMNRQWRARVPCGGSAVISEYIASVIQDNVEDHIEPRLMRGVHQCTQFLVGIRRIDRKPGFRSKKIVDAVAVVDALIKWKIFQHPDF